MAQCGAGVTLAPDDGADESRRLVDERDVGRITDAITTVLATGSFGLGARRVADEMAASPSVDDVLATLVHGDRSAPGEGEGVASDPAETSMARMPRPMRNRPPKP